MEKSGKHRYTLRDIQTGEIICADLTAGEVHHDYRNPVSTS